MIPRTNWTEAEQVIWRRIAGHPFEDPAVTLDFAGRLARTLGWTIDTTRGAIEEYRRFCFLATVGPTPATPSEEVDEVWHLHLTYSRDYWERWCGQALGRPLHHDPTVGGPAEQARFRAQYAETLARYEAYFGPPDPRFWPGTAQRFNRRPRYRMIDGDRALVVPRPTLCFIRSARSKLSAIVLLLVSGRPAAADPTNVLDWPGDRFLMLYGMLGVLALSVAYLAAHLIRATGRWKDARGLTNVEIAYMSEGAARAADTFIIELAQSGMATVEAPSTAVTVHRSAAQQEFLAPGYHRRGEARKGFRASIGFQRLRDGLIKRNLLVSRTRYKVLVGAILSIVLPVIALGVTKVFVGMDRNRPVGFLVIFLIVTVILLVSLLRRQNGLTSAGAAVLARLHQDNQRAMRAPTGEELAFAFALVGTAALVGTPYHAYAASGGGGSGCGSSGDGGSGCGGGGCGGCGG